MLGEKDTFKIRQGHLPTAEVGLYKYTNNQMEE